VRLRHPPDAASTIEVPSPFDFDESLRFVPFGPYDPTCRRVPDRLWKAAWTPEGPVTLALSRSPTGVEARAWGGGAEWSLARAGPFLGLGDSPEAFSPSDRPVAAVARRGRGVRLSRSPWVLDGLCEYVLQQRVAFRDAARAHRRLVQRVGAAAPGPPGLLLPLRPAEWLALVEPDWRRAGVDGQRARTLRAAARAARRVNAAFDLGPAEARRAIASVPGCGPWTVEITMGFVLGDPDAVPTGDLHLPGRVGFLLAGEPAADDRRMIELLEPYRGHRFRLLRLLLAAGRLHLGRSVRPGWPIA
jgi:3-methyladenine DNA glycosylase/8-oxoguanine DNA glycosylase